MLIAFFASLSALIFELAMGHFLSLTLGNSAFGYSFVVSLFLASMGIGSLSFRSVERTRHEALQKLYRIEIYLALIALVALPLLSYTTGLAKEFLPLYEGCRSLICGRGGLLVLALDGVLIFLAGFLIGQEIPLFLEITRKKPHLILAADYGGAFVAGIVFPLISLPMLGLFGSLLLSASLQCGVILYLLATHRELRTRRYLMALALCLAPVITLWGLKDRTEKQMLLWIVANHQNTSSQIEVFENTGKQSVLLITHQTRDQKIDRRLYLDGYLQSSSLWNENQYHEKMGVRARALLGNDSKKILILGGGDGFLADHLLQKFPQDRMTIVDFDCKFLNLAASNAHLLNLNHSAFAQPQVNTVCFDAFAFLKKIPTSEWDLILVDFPHGVGDAAALKVEGAEFFIDLYNRLRPQGIAVFHHERFGSEEQVCVEDTLRVLGFSTQSVAVEEGELVSEAMIYATKSGEPRVDLSKLSTTGQNIFKQNCIRPLKRFGAIWIGS